MKTTIGEMKTTLDGINGRLDITEEKTITFENTTIESKQDER